MSRNSLFYSLTFGCLSLLVSGCGGDAPKPSNSASPSPAASPAARATPPSVAPVAAIPITPAAPVAKTGEPTTNSLQPSFSGDIAAGLIPASDAEAATKAVAKGRPDPFSAVIAQPYIPVASRAATPSTTTPSLASTVKSTKSAKTLLPVAAINPAVKSGNNWGVNSKLVKSLDLSSDVKVSSFQPAVKPASQKLAAKGESKTAASKTKPQIDRVAIASVSSIPAKAPLVPGKTALLTPPAAAPILPALAKAIQVSGISEINGQTQVIVKLPGESFSRYLSVGEKVLDGKVLIKRVKDPTALAPTVVLEEAGVEVFRKVGEKPAAADTGKGALDSPE